VNPPAGSGTINGVLSASVYKCGVEAQCYVSVDQLSPELDSAKASTSSITGGFGAGVNPATVTLAADIDSMVIDMITGWSDLGVPTKGVDQTLRYNGVTGFNNRMAGSDAPGSALTTMRWTMQSNDPSDPAWSLVAVSLRPSSVPAAPKPTNHILTRHLHRRF